MTFAENVLAFFAEEDEIVNENLVERFCNDVKSSKKQSFSMVFRLLWKIFIVKHTLLIDTYVKDLTKIKNYLFNAIETIPSVQKVDWALRWISG